MPEYNNELTGVLFPNDKKGNEKAPDFKGDCQIDGVKIQVAAWSRKSKGGQPYISLKFEKPKPSRDSTW